MSLWLQFNRAAGTVGHQDGCDGDSLQKSPTSPARANSDCASSGV
jgi:hypothetical protein